MLPALVALVAFPIILVAFVAFPIMDVSFGICAYAILCTPIKRNNPPIMVTAIQILFRDIDIELILSYINIVYLDSCVQLLWASFVFSYLTDLMRRNYS